MFPFIGLNKRNFTYITDYNPRKYFPLVDDKIRCKEILKKASIPHPETIGIVSSFVQISRAVEGLKKHPEFVIKPSRGRAGGGIKLLKSTEQGFTTMGGSPVNNDEMIKHMGDILFGVYSFGKMSDAVLIEKKIEQHTVLNEIYMRGVADIRIILFKNRPVMGMLRIPTSSSDGKANLHQGAIGLELDIESGITGSGHYKKERIIRHPDSNAALKGLKLPHWEEILSYSIRASREVPLQYMGVDIVLDEHKGPMILEMNARPGLQIQVVNQKGLRPLLSKLEKDDE